MLKGAEIKIKLTPAIHSIWAVATKKVARVWF